MEDISFEDIEKLDDVLEMFRLASEIGVDLTGCETLEDFKERFVLHKRKLMKKLNTTEETDECWYESMKIDMDKKRKALVPIFLSIKKVLSSGLQCIQAIMEARGFPSNLCETIQQRVDVLSSGEYYIVIAGATGSGKSTFLNLLLGMEILPIHTLSCTATVCKLKYARHFSARVCGKNGQVYEYKYKDLHEARTHLEEHIFVRENSARENIQAKEVQIYLPADILMSGITLVDTPGIDENEAMDNLVKQFIATNHIAAFIYMIKTDHSGGVPQYGLLSFLESILSSNTMERFNPKAAMFICNKWDQIPDCEKDKVRENALKKLGAVWTDLQPSQVTFFSTKHSKDLLEIDKDYTTTQLLNLLSDLNNLFALAMQNSLVSNYCWLKHVLRECTVYTKTIISRIRSSQQEQEDTFCKAAEKMEALRTRSFQVLSDIRSQINDESLKMAEKVKSFLQRRDIVGKLLTWREEEIPFYNIADAEGVPWDMVCERKDLAIIRKIFDLLDTWDETSIFSEGIEERIASDMKTRLCLLDADMNKISNYLDDANSLKSSLRSSISSSVSSNTSYDEDNIAQTILKTSSSNRGVVRRLKYLSDTQQGSSTGSIAKALAARVVVPIANVLEKKSRKSSNASPISYMVNRADKTVKSIVKDHNALMNIVARYTTLECEQLSAVETNIPKFISANERLMAEVRILRSTIQQDAYRLRLMMEDFEKQKEHLRGFGELYVREISSNDVSLLFDDSQLASSAVIKLNLSLKHASEQGRMEPFNANSCLWSVVDKGFVDVDGERRAVTVKIYKRNPEEGETIKEIAKLRCLDHAGVATFVGMSRMKTQSAFMYLYLEHHVSARAFLSRQTVGVKQVVTDIIEGVVNGLEHIHKESLVHMELTQDTVMVNALGQVKLCGACLPQKAIFPMERDFVEAGNFTCLSPEVLKGMVYEADSDIYSFGLLVWQLIVGDHPYKRYWGMKLSEFMSEIHPSTMLHVPEQSPNLKKLLRGCVICDYGKRMAIKEIRESLSELKQEDSIETLKYATRQRIINRKSKLP